MAIEPPSGFPLGVKREEGENRLGGGMLSSQPFPLIPFMIILHEGQGGGW